MRTHLPVWLAIILAMTSPRAQDALDAPPAQPMVLLNDREAAQLRAVLATPAPQSATVETLRRHFAEKTAAALRLSDARERERVLREAMERLPADSRWVSDLAGVLKTQERWDESRTLYDTAIERATRPVDRLFYESNLMRLQLERRANDAAERALQVRRSGETLLAGLAASQDRVTVLRALGAAAGVEAVLQARRGEFHDGLAAAAESERRFREALETAEALPGAALIYPATDLANAQKQRIAALNNLGRFGEAEAVLSEHLSLIQRYPVSTDFAAGAHHTLANLRMQRREFAEAERQLRLARQVLDVLGHARTSSTQVSKTADLATSLWARQLYADARREIDALDEQARRDKTPPGRVRIAFERGLVDLMTDRAAAATGLFAEVAQRNRASYGSGHFYVAQASGLQGVALWRSGKDEQREQATELLKQAVFDYQLTRNADFLNDAAIRKPVRELIYSTYLEAMAQRGGLQALLALGVADRLLDGVTAQAMADAALRSSAGNPALAALVRQDQDTRNELQALQQALQVSAGPDVLAESDAARARRRVNELELIRQQAQERIRGRFPGYDRLLRPPLPSATDVAQRLGRDEVLLLAVPTERALYVWAMTADELPLFARVDIGLPVLQALVKRVRTSLDFAAGNGRLVPFDAPAANELYRHALAPVAERVRGRRHLIVAATGPLALIPFATLLSAPAQGNPGTWPWLARDFAISHVPSVSAWLTLRQSPPGQSAPEPLMAWGDPLFARPATAARSAGARTSATRTNPARDPAPQANVAQRVELPPLPETRAELLAIAAALKGSEQDLLLGASATRESVLEASRSGLLGKKRVVLFATHGLMAGDLPGLDQPALALSASADNRSPLSALIGLDDVLSLTLNADWVVLSACNTAAADGKANEALSGLARAFLYAGSRSLLVTHWPVETESAKRITVGIFEHHAANPRSTKAESLRQSMLRLLALPEYSHPAFWAPYVLVGDGGR